MLHSSTAPWALASKSQRTKSVFLYHAFFLLFIYVPTNVLKYITILNYITNAPTCFGASAPSTAQILPYNRPTALCNFNNFNIL